MNAKVLKALNEQIVDMEAQQIVAETTLFVIDTMGITGKQADMVAQQKAAMESTLQMQKLVIAALKKRVEEENTEKGDK